MSDKKDKTTMSPEDKAWIMGEPGTDIREPIKRAIAYYEAEIEALIAEMWIGL